HRREAGQEVWIQTHLPTKVIVVSLRIRGQGTKGVGVTWAGLFFDLGRFPAVKLEGKLKKCKTFAHNNFLRLPATFRQPLLRFSPQKRTMISRRNFLSALGVTTAAGVTNACRGISDSGPTTPPPNNPPPPPPPPAGSLKESIQHIVFTMQEN